MSMPKKKATESDEDFSVRLKSAKKRERESRDPEKVRARARQWTRDNPERNAQRASEWRKKNPGARMKWHYDKLSQYPSYSKEAWQRWRSNNPEKFAERNKRITSKRRLLSPEDYQKALEYQNHQCFICGKRHVEGKGSTILHIDHCHKSEKIRGLLCSSCNMGLGSFKDDPNRLRAAADYLERNW